MKINYSVLSGMLLLFGLFAQCAAALESEVPMLEEKAAFEKAVREGDLQTLRGFRYLHSCSEDRAPLHVAAEHGHAEVYFYLLERALNSAYCRDLIGRTLNGACRGGLFFGETSIRSNKTEKQLILDLPDVESSLSFTALMHAVRGGFGGFASQLLHAGASIEGHGLEPFISPINLALSRRDLDMIQRLCHFGADLLEFPSDAELHNWLSTRMRALQSAHRAMMYDAMQTRRRGDIHAQREIYAAKSVQAREGRVQRLSREVTGFGPHFWQRGDIVRFLVRHGVEVAAEENLRRIYPDANVTEEQEVIGRALNESVQFTDFPIVVNQLVLGYLSPHLRMPTQPTTQIGARVSLPSIQLLDDEHTMRTESHLGSGTSALSPDEECWVAASEKHRHAINKRLDAARGSEAKRDGRRAEWNRTSLAWKLISLLLCSRAR